MGLVLFGNNRLTTFRDFRRIGVPEKWRGRFVEPPREGSGRVDQAGSRDGGV